mmetsp:Transcript_54152/g.128221  ORF Transcript_54152/g.128221 Transcript_54152/m.128221 type:complete len:210 (-) Transcript_54152:388-1017(-)
MTRRRRCCTRGSPRSRSSRQRTTRRRAGCTRRSSSVSRPSTPTRSKPPRTRRRRKRAQHPRHSTPRKPTPKGRPRNPPPSQPPRRPCPPRRRPARPPRRSRPRASSSRSLRRRVCRGWMALSPRWRWRGGRTPPRRRRALPKAPRNRSGTRSSCSASPRATLTPRPSPLTCSRRRGRPWRGSDGCRCARCSRGSACRSRQSTRAKTSSA